MKFFCVLKSWSVSLLGKYTLICIFFNIELHLFTFGKHFIVSWFALLIIMNLLSI